MSSLKAASAAILIALLPLMSRSLADDGPAAVKFSFDSSTEGFSATGGTLRREATDGGGLLVLQASFPGSAGIERPLPSGAGSYTRASARICVPADAPDDLRVSVYMKDKDGMWWEAASSQPAVPGAWANMTFDTAPRSHAMRGSGHEAVWGKLLAERATALGLSVFSATRWSGSIQIDDVRLDTDVGPRGTLHIRHLHQEPSPPVAYRPLQLSFELSREPSNPFDPDELRVDASFTSPSGRTMTVPCFYYQPCRREMDAEQEEVVTPSGRSSWQARFTPLEAGSHTWQLIVRYGDEKLETNKHRFEVQPGKPHGFVRISPADSRYFETADGAFFYPIGENIHAPFDKRCAEMLRVPVLPNRGTFAYDYYFEKMAESGQNAVVVWMSNWWASIEWTKKWKNFHGLNDYNLVNAWRLDQLFDAAARHGIYINLVLDNHGKFSKYVDPEWDTNPYNAALGGPCRTPEEFFTSDEAFSIYSKRLRYIVARWGSHPNLLGFELISELNIVGSDRRFRNHPCHASWVARVAKYLDGIDAYHRPITIQYSNTWESVDKNVAALPELDYLVGDIYKGGGSVIPHVIKTAEMNGRFAKPTFTVEFGGNWNGTTPARLQADLHAGLWSNAVTTTAGAPFFWWFDFIDRYNLYNHFKAFSSFMAGEDRRGLDLATRELPVTQAGEPSKDIGCVALLGADRAWAYLYDTLYAEIMPEDRFARSHSGSVVVLPGLREGSYEVEYWDTFSGSIVEQAKALADADGLQLKVPDFKIDIAMKVMHQEEKQ